MTYFPHHLSRHCPHLVLLAAGLLLAGCQAATPTSREDLLDFRQVVSSAKDKVFPSVVFIRSTVEDLKSGRKITVDGNGSGVVISPRGEVLTNWHVVDKAVEIRCLMLDGRSMDAQVIGTDKDTDLALLQLSMSEEDADLPYSRFGDSDKLREGDFVMAMGAPWGLSRSVSIGIISCTRRYLRDHSEYSLWLQTDASISPGNSGGPLVDTEGRIVGINTRGVTSGGDVGFSIPANTARRIADQLREHGKVNWSWTGLQLQPLKDFDRDMYFEGEEGVIVAGTDPESPARRAGIEPRDRILSIAGQPVTAMTDEDLPAVRRLLGTLAKGQQVDLEVARAGQTQVIPLTPREKGEVEGEEYEFTRWDFTAKQINQFDNPDLYFYQKQGLFIYGIKRPGNAADSGLRPGDIIVSVDGEQIETVEDLKQAHDEAMANIKTKTKVTMMVRRGPDLKPLVLKYHREYQKD